MKEIKIEGNLKKLFVVLIINLFIFIIVNLFTCIRYEQIDDFTIYLLYSGLDGIYNYHAIYMHPVICIFLGFLFRIVSFINWHTVYLLLMQFICFTCIGYTILKKHYTKLSILLYSLFAGVSYILLLMFLQYTSVAALLILTSLFLIIDNVENSKERTNKKRKFIFGSILFTLGIMTRMQSLLILIPFFGIYFLIYLVKFFRKNINKEQFIRIIKLYLLCGLITILVFVSNNLMYNNDVYKEYNKWNSARTVLQDMMNIDYNDYMDIFEKVNWSSNDIYIFKNFDHGDEKIFSKDKLETILDLKMKKDNNFGFKTSVKDIFNGFTYDITNVVTYLFIMFFVMYIFNLYRRNKICENTIIFFITIFIHIIFIIINRNPLRIIIPEYIFAIAIFIYNLNYVKEERIVNKKFICLLVLLVLLFAFILVKQKYFFDYDADQFNYNKEVIEYTNNHKENTYLFTVHSILYRFLAYSPYLMPPENSFTNLRAIGGWDMYTENYYIFNEKNNLDGTFLDLLKDNVYLIDANEKIDNIKKNIVYAIKEHYNIDIKFKVVKSFDNLMIYKAVLADK